MRVIAGKYRGKRLSSPAEKAKVRPTADRIKETMFNILFSKGVLDGVRALDLFAGSGSLGIEVLSRGAQSCVFVDIDAESCRLVRENLSVVGITAEVYRADYKAAVPKLSGREFDLIFVDPPYASGKESEIVSLVLQYRILAGGGVIVIEHSRENRLEGLPQACIRDTRECGNTQLTFLEVQS